MKSVVYNKSGKEVEKIEINDAVFNAPVNKKVLSQYVYSYLSNQRESNAKTKDRSEVSGGGKKPFKQKGTGRARAGSSRSPIWKGGGVTFGPTNEANYKKKITKKFRAAAFRSAFSYLAKKEMIKLVDEFSFKGDKSLTKMGLGVLKAFDAPKKVLIITASKNEEALKAFSNIEKVYVQSISKINVYDLLNYPTVLLEKGALEYITKWEKSISVK